MKLSVIKYLCLISIALFIWRCNSKEKDVLKSANEINMFQNPEADSTIKYAKRFSISENNICKIIYLFGNLNINDTSATFIIAKDSTTVFPDKKNTFVLKQSCKKIASLSSVYSSMITELGEINKIVAIENVDYYNNALILNKFNSKNLIELSKGPELDVEQTLLLKPDIIFSFGMGNSPSAANEKIIRANIPIVVAVDHLEENPLARAEWIKFFAAFVNKARKADSIFAEVEKNYDALKKIAASVDSKPTVFTEIKFGEIWYVPGGKSFMANFINDAGGSYIWNDNEKTGSLNLGFEEVYVKAKNADFWLNQALVKTKAELLSLEKRYSDFRAFKIGNLYNNIKNTNNKGYSDYWETGIMYPNRILSDLIQIFHPELKAQIKNDLYYYKKLN